MTDFKLHHGLDQLADEAEPAPIDVYDIIAKANARSHNRKAALATSLAVVTVAGGMVAAIGLTSSDDWPVTGSPSTHTTRPTTSTSIPPKPTLNNKSRHFTQVLADAWPTIAPAGVTVEKSDYHLSALEFGGSVGSVNAPDQLLYDAQAKLSDAQGSTQLTIQIWPPGDQIIDFTPYIPDQNRDYRQLEDGTQANLWTDTDPIATAVGTVEADVLRPDGTRITLREDNTGGPMGQELTRPTTFFTAEQLIQFGLLFTY